MSQKKSGIWCYKDLITRTGWPGQEVLSPLRKWSLSSANKIRALRPEAWASVVAQTVKKSGCNVGEPGSIRNITFQYSCLEKSPGQKAWWACNPWDYKESDSTEGLTLWFHFSSLGSCSTITKSSCASTREKSVGHSEDLLQQGKSKKKKKKGILLNILQSPKLLQPLTNNTHASDRD